MPSITSGLGIGSGIDIKDIVDKLVAAEGKYKVERFDREETKINAKMESINSITTALNGFQSTLSDLSSPSAFSQYTANVSDSLYFSATASTAADSYYDIHVQQIAESNKVSTAPFAGATSIVGQGTLTFTVNGAVASLTIGPEQQTLSGIAQAINQSSNILGVTASLVTTDLGTSMVMTSVNTGSANAINISVSGDTDGNDTDDSGLSALITTYLTQVDPAQDAIITIDGNTNTLTSATNTISTAINGVTLNLIAPHPTLTQTSRLTIEPDITAVTNTIMDFVDAYNAVVTQVNAATLFAGTGSNAANGPLLGDTTLRLIQYGMLDVINQTVGDNTPGFQLLAQIGITTNQSTGLLEADPLDLADALNSNFDAVGDLFALSDGIANTMSDFLDDFTDYNGILSMRETGLESSLDRISDDRLLLENRLKELEKRLMNQFIAMDKVVAKLKNTSEFLKDALKNLPKPGHRD